MSALAKYLENVRVEKNMTLEESAKKANMTLESYIQREKAPEKVPLYMLASMLKALELNREQFVEFSVLTSQHIWD